MIIKSITIMQNKVTLEFALMMKKEYDAGLSMVQLSKKYKTDVYYVFNKFNIPKRNKQEYKNWKITHRDINRYQLKWDCNSISNEIEAYIIGLFMADGYVGNSQVGLRLKKSDKLLVKRVKDYFSTDITLQEDKNSYNFVISSIEVCNNLKKLGVLSHKTNKELFIPKMDSSLVRHFIRGFFDGDGSIFLCHNNKNYYLKSNICSPTQKILKNIQIELKKHDIESTINIEHRKGKQLKVLNSIVIGSLDMYRLFIRKKSSLQKWFIYLYKDSTIYLKRKFDIFNDNLELCNYKK